MAPHALPPSDQDTVMQDVGATPSASSKSEPRANVEALTNGAAGSSSLPTSPNTVKASSILERSSYPTSRTLKVPLHVEVCQNPQRTTSHDKIADLVRRWILSDMAAICPGTKLTGWHRLSGLRDTIQSVTVAETSSGLRSVDVSQASLNIHVYSPSSSEAEDLPTEGAEEGQLINSATVCSMPNVNAEGLWESLFYSDDVKNDLLNYIYATIQFSKVNVDTNIVAWNRVVLLYGPPGTGKTSLCRALAQKLSIRLNKDYPETLFIEINSHSLFSRWFSESGKLVQNLFTCVQELCDDAEKFVVVLIDEVESITAARAGSVSAGEPTDALRVVNALLTQLDKLKQRKNVLVVTTSNLIDSIDPAFKDRADIVKYIGVPPQDGIYWILRGCLIEITSKGLITNDVRLMDLTQRRHVISVDPREKRVSDRLYHLSGKCQGMSGRTLRRLPVLAASKYLGGASLDEPAPVELFIEAMEMVVQSGITQATS